MIARSTFMYYMYNKMCGQFCYVVSWITLEEYWASYLNHLALRQLGSRQQIMGPEKPKIPSKWRRIWIPDLILDCPTKS